MAEKLGIEQIVEQVVARVLESHIPRLRDDLVREVFAHLQTQGQAGGQSAQTEAGEARKQYAANLVNSVAAIHSGSSQKEILAALLDNTARYSGRSALFVMKAGNASGWQGRAFANVDDIKNFALQVSTGLAAQVIDSRAPASGAVAEVDPNFILQFGAPAHDHVLLLPLLLKDKLAAIVYADPGSEGRLDHEALELLVASASAWLEVSSLRKQAQKDGMEGVERQDSAPAVHAVSSAPDPFAPHAPAHSAPVASAATIEQAAHDEAPQAMAAAATASSAVPVRSAQDDEIHRKAQRFARLLMDEIKLYNQAKVNEGRKHKDLYDRLKEDIEKSRATYKKRYGNTPAASGDYFNHELLRSLAEDDVALMGANFRQS
jgi:hypothetical protein